MKLMVINGSVRQGRSSDRVLNWAKPLLEADKELTLDIVDLKELALPFYDEPMGPMMSHDTYQNPKGTAWAKRVAEADAFLMLTPEYNHGPSAVLKNAIDWVHYGWNNKPVGFISYGSLAAGTRAVQQLKQNVLELKLYPAHDNVQIPLIWEAFNDQGKPKHAGLDDQLKGLVAELKEMQRRLAS